MAKTPQRPELNALFEMPPQDAIDYLKAKGFKIGWDWHETLNEAHSRAFTVAKVARIDLLQDIRKSLIDAMQQGQGFEQWKANITPHFSKRAGGENKQSLILRVWNNLFSWVALDALKPSLTPICTRALPLGDIRP
jgi:uncharacterized protein with gpF-like domain